MIYAAVLHLLRRHGVVRTLNNPIGDIAEWMVTEKMNLKRAPPSTKYYDATDEHGSRYQIKARRRSGGRFPSQFGPISEPSLQPFDFLVLVVFDEDFLVERAAIIPIKAVQRLVKAASRPGVFTFNLSKSVMRDPDVRDITGDLDAFPATVQEEQFLARVAALSDA